MLTDAAIRKLSCREKPYKVADMYGLYPLMHPNGSRYWRFDYRHVGKRGTLVLGVYPEVSLKEAREKRENAVKMLEKGVNPSTYRKLTRGVASIANGDSFKAVAEEWLSKIEAEGRSTATMEKLRWLLSFAYPLIGERAADRSAHCARDIDRATNDRSARPIRIGPAT